MLPMVPISAMQNHCDVNCPFRAKIAERMGAAFNPYGVLPLWEKDGRIEEGKMKEECLTERQFPLFFMSR